MATARQGSGDKPAFMAHAGREEIKTVFVEGLLPIAREKLVTIATDASLIDAARLLTAGTDIVVVCDAAGAVRGVVTKTDVVGQIGRSEGTNCDCPADSVMSRDVAMCRVGDRLQDVAALMKTRHLKNLPVVDRDDRPIGVLTARVVLRALLGDAEHEEAQLIDYIKGVGYR